MLHRRTLSYAHTMYQRKLTLIIFVSLLFNSLAICQSPFIDSLYQSYLNEPVETKYHTLKEYCIRLIQHDLERASSLLKKGELELPKADLSKTEVAFHLGNFAFVRALIAQNKGDMRTSLKCFQEAFEFSKKVDGEEKYNLKADAKWGMAAYYGEQGFYYKSTQQFLEAEETYLKGGIQLGRANCFAMIAQNYQSESKFDSTLIFCNKALSLIDPEKSKNHFYSYLWFKVNAFNKLELPDSTIQLLSENLFSDAVNQNPAICAHLRFGLADAYSAKKMALQAKKQIKAGKKILDDTKDSQLNRDYLLSMHLYYLAAEDYKGAYETKMKLEEYQDTLDKKLTDAKFMELQSKYDTQNKEFEIASLKNKTQYQSNLLKLGGGLFAVILGSLFFWVKQREEKIKAIQSKNIQQIKVATKYEDATSEIENEFLKNITNFIQDNLANEELTVDDLVRHCGMNRNVMNKKIKSLVNKTAVGLIRDMRLEKAYLILHQNDENISQVAFKVGFKDPSYFTTCFKEKFGFTPSSLLKNV